MGDGADGRSDILNMTLAYYEKNARKFIEGTITAGMSEIRRAFLSRITKGGRILDLGCGSGRDGKAFMDAGYKVVLVDGSKEMCKAAAELTGQACIHSTFEGFVPQGDFDGIWACASLLHLSEADIRSIVEMLMFSLKPGGCFYMSFKYGDFSGERNGRFFTDLTEERLQGILFGIKGVAKVEARRTVDVRPGRSEEKWLNVYLVKDGETMD